MKTKPFNLEEAKAGKPFRILGKDVARMRFVGARIDGHIAYEASWPAEQYRHHYLGSLEPDKLEMIVETKTVKFEVWQYLDNSPNALDAIKYAGLIRAFESVSEWKKLGEFNFEYEV